MTPELRFAEPTRTDGSQAIKRERSQIAARGKRLQFCLPMNWHV